MPNPENIKPHQFKPGQSGNPNGYSRGRRQIDDLLELIQETAGAERAISKAWLKRLLNGEFQHLKEYLDRRDGKLANKVEMTETRVDWSALDNEGDTERPSVSATGPKPLPESGQA